MYCETQQYCRLKQKNKESRDASVYPRTWSATQGVPQETCCINWVSIKSADVAQLSVAEKRPLMSPRRQLTASLQQCKALDRELDYLALWKSRV